MRVLFFWLQAFWKTVLWPFFSYEFINFFGTHFFSLKVFVLLASGILEDGSVAFFHMNLKVFLKQTCIFNESVCFFGFRHSGRRFCGFFII